MDKATILVLDDVDVVRIHILEMLDGLGIGPIIEADTADRAVIAINLHRPKVAILDIQVPGTDELKNGMDVLRWIRINSPETAVIMLTNHNLPVYRRTCLALGAVHFFDKSIEFDNLCDAVKALLELEAK